MLMNITTLFLKKLPKFEILHVTMDTNATNVQHFVAWLNNITFNHIHDVKIGATIIFMKIVNISKGVKNGATTIITSI